MISVKAAVLPEYNKLAWKEATMVSPGILPASQTQKGFEILEEDPEENIQVLLAFKNH